MIDEATVRVLVIGASGGTGKHVVRLLLEAGHEVTAFARNPASVAEWGDRVRVAKGEARDAASLAAAVKGCDAVVSTFGPRSLKKDDLQQVFMRNLLAAMKAHGVRRLVNLSAWGAGDSRDTVPLIFKLIRATILREIYRDKDRGEALLVASDLSYVNVRPGRLTDGPARGGVKASLDGKGVAQSIPREDVAKFMVAQLTSDSWVRQSPVIG